MNVSKRKMKKRYVDHTVLTTIYRLQADWKKTEEIIEHSVEPSEGSLIERDIALAKYMFMLREARERNLTALRFSP